MGLHILLYQGDHVLSHILFPDLFTIPLFIQLFPDMPEHFPDITKFGWF